MQYVPREWQSSPGEPPKQQPLEVALRSLPETSHNLLISPLPDFGYETLPSIRDTPLPDIGGTIEAYSPDPSTPPREGCGAAGCPLSCNCEEVRFFSDDARNTPRLIKGVQGVELSRPTSSSLLSITAPRRSRPTLSASRNGSRSASVSGPRSRVPTRPSSPTAAHPVVTGSLPAVPLSSSSRGESGAGIPISQPAELRSRLSDLLADTPPSSVSSSLPNMSYGSRSSNSPLRSDSQPEYGARRSETIDVLPSRPPMSRSGSRKVVPTAPVDVQSRPKRRSREHDPTNEVPALSSSLSAMVPMPTNATRPTAISTASVAALASERAHKQGVEERERRKTAKARDTGDRDWEQYHDGTERYGEREWERALRKDGSERSSRSSASNASVSSGKSHSSRTGQSNHPYPTSVPAVVVSSSSSTSQPERSPTTSFSSQTSSKDRGRTSSSSAYPSVKPRTSHERERDEPYAQRHSPPQGPSLYAHANSANPPLSTTSSSYPNAHTREYHETATRSHHREREQNQAQSQSLGVSRGKALLQSNELFSSAAYSTVKG